jgi:hypothetical protein
MNYATAIALWLTGCMYASSAPVAAAGAFVGLGLVVIAMAVESKK